jgi:hypothetical protein
VAPRSLDRLVELARAALCGFIEALGFVTVSGHHAVIGRAGDRLTASFAMWTLLASSTACAIRRPPLKAPPALVAHCG